MLLQQLINGIVLGCTYSLLALGYTLIFGVLKIFHIAHGDVMMVGTVLVANLILFMHVDFFTALIVGMGGAMLVGILTERLTIRPLRRGGRVIPAASPLVATLGAAIILQEIIIKMFGAEALPFPALYQEQSYRLGPITITFSQFVIIAVSVCLMVCLHVMVAKTKWGKGMRAVAENSKTASLLGINVNAIVMVTFMIASALAGACGLLLGMAYAAYSPFMGVLIGIKGFTIIVIGGMGNIWGAMVGGLVLGMVEILSVGYLASSFRDVFAFAVMILILVIKPTGLFGSRTVV